MFYYCVNVFKSLWLTIILKDFQGVHIDTYWFFVRYIPGKNRYVSKRKTFAFIIGCITNEFRHSFCWFDTIFYLFCNFINKVGYGTICNTIICYVNKFLYNNLISISIKKTRNWLKYYKKIASILLMWIIRIYSYLIANGLLNNTSGLISIIHSSK